MVDGDKSVIAIGRTSPRSGIGGVPVVDMFVFKLDAASGTEIWRYQVLISYRQSRLFVHAGAYVS